MERSRIRTWKALGVATSAALVLSPALPAVAAPPLAATTQISKAFDGSAANGGSYVADMTPDGRFVAYTTYASNILPDDTNGFADVILYDRSTGHTVPVSIGLQGGMANNDSYAASISDDGRFVAFDSLASDLVPGDTNRRWDAFVYDVVNDATRRVSVSATGQETSWGGQSAQISGDGRSVAFVSEARLDSDPTQSSFGIYWRSVAGGPIERIDSAAAPYTGGRLDVTRDGRVVVFDSGTGVYARDRHAGTTVQVFQSATTDAESYGGGVSADGNKVLFSSPAPDAKPGLPDDGRVRLFLRDLITRTTMLVPTAGTCSVESADLSADANHAVYSCGSTLFLSDLRTGHQVRAEAFPDGTPTTGGTSMAWSVVSTGGTVVALSTDKRLVPGETVEKPDVFARLPQTSIIPQPAVIGTNPIRTKLFYQAQLLDGANRPMVGKVLTFKVEGRTVCSATTDAAGYASCTMYTDQLLTMLTRTGGYTVEYAGSSTTFPSSAFAWWISG